MLYLKAMNPEDAAAEYACLQDLPGENGFTNEAYGIPFECFVEEEIPRRLRCAQGRDLLPGRVPETYFFLWDGDTPVALFKVRHFLNDALRKGSGHMGYGVRRTCRGRGYATRGLALAIEEARDGAGERTLSFRWQGKPGFPAGAAEKRGIHTPPGRRKILYQNQAMMYEERDT